MNNIIHKPLELPEVTRTSKNGKRLYVTPSGKMYPSVTSVTSLGSEESIKAWKARVGEEEANKISNRASGRGTRIHSLCEDWLNNKEVFPEMFDIDMWDTFNPVLKNINNVYGLETMLFSHKLELAGTADCIAEYNGKLSIIDFKTSGKLKKKEWISNYFVQCAFYSMMVLELTGIFAEQIVVLIAVDDNESQIFIEQTRDWMPEAIKVRQEFRKVKGY